MLLKDFWRLRRKRDVARRKRDEFTLFHSLLSLI